MSRTGPRKSSRERGFTLVELLIVCAIIGLLLCGSVPAFRESFRSAALRRAARDVCVTLRYARERAVSEEWGYVVRFEKDSNRCRLIRVTAPSDPGSGSNDDARGRLDLPKEVAIEESSYPMTAEGFYVAFYPDGSADEGDILLGAPGGEKRETATIRITGLTGGVGLEGA